VRGSEFELWVEKPTMAIVNSTEILAQTRAHIGTANLE